MTVLNLPRPPSVNALYRNVPKVGRVKTKAYRDWIKEAGWELQAQRPKPVQGDYLLLVLVGPTRADLGNLEKAVSDLLQSHGVVENDRRASGIALERRNDIPKNRITCSIHAEKSDKWISLGDAVNGVIGNIARGKV